MQHGTLFHGTMRHGHVWTVRGVSSLLHSHTEKSVIHARRTSGRERHTNVKEVANSLFVRAVRNAKADT